MSGPPRVSQAHAAFFFARASTSTCKCPVIAPKIAARLFMLGLPFEGDWQRSRLWP